MCDLNHWESLNSPGDFLNSSTNGHEAICLSALDTSWINAYDQGQSWGVNVGRAVESTGRSKVVKGHKRKSRGSKSKSMKIYLTFSKVRVPLGHVHVHVISCSLWKFVVRKLMSSSVSTDLDSLSFSFSLSPCALCLLFAQAPNSQQY